MDLNNYQSFDLTFDPKMCKFGHPKPGAQNGPKMMKQICFNKVVSSIRGGQT